MVDEKLGKVILFSNPKAKIFPFWNPFTNKIIIIKDIEERANEKMAGWNIPSMIFRRNTKLETFSIYINFYFPLKGKSNAFKIQKEKWVEWTGEKNVQLSTPGRQVPRSKCGQKKKKNDRRLVASNEKPFRIRNAFSFFLVMVCRIIMSLYIFVHVI